MSHDKKVVLLKVVALLLLAALSFFGAAKIADSLKMQEQTNRYLDEKKVAVLELAGAAAATSLAVSMLPDDLGTPIANELASLSSYFLLIVSAIVFEKYLYGIAGAAAFRYLIPIACGLGILSVLLGNRSFRKAAEKTAAFALAVFLIVPTSVKLSCFIEEKYNCSAEETVASLTQDAAEIAEDDSQTQQNTVEEAEKKTWWGSIVDALSDTAEKLKDSVSETASSVKEKVNTLLSKFIDVVAVMIVTSCVIPITVLLALLWLTKLIFSLDWDLKGGAENFFAYQKERREKREKRADNYNQ